MASLFSPDVWQGIALACAAAAVEALPLARVLPGRASAAVADTLVGHGALAVLAWWLAASPAAGGGGAWAKGGALGGPGSWLAAGACGV